MCHFVYFLQTDNCTKPLRLRANHSVNPDCYSPGLLRCNRPITLYKFNGACVPLGPRQLRTGCAFSTLPRSLLLAGFRGLQRFRGPLYFRSMKKVVDS